MGEMTGKWEQRRFSQDFTTALPPSPSRQLNLQIGSNLVHIYMFVQFSPCARDYWNQIQSRFSESEVFWSKLPPGRLFTFTFSLSPQLLLSAKTFLESWISFRRNCCCSADSCVIRDRLKSRLAWAATGSLALTAGRIKGSMKTQIDAYNERLS